MMAGLLGAGVGMLAAVVLAGMLAAVVLIQLHIEGRRSVLRPGVLWVLVVTGVVGWLLLVIGIAGVVS